MNNRKYVGLDGRTYDIGAIYLEGTILKLIRHGEPRILDAEVDSDELDLAVADCGSIRIYTKPCKRKNS